MTAQLVKLHREYITVKLDPNSQKIVKTIKWRDNILIYLEEVEIDNTSKMKIDQLINLKELENTGVNHTLHTMDDVSNGLFRDQLFFSTTQPQI